MIMEVIQLAERSNTTFVREVSVNYRGRRRASIKIDGPESAAEFIRKVLPDNSREHFITLHLDGGHNIAAFSVTATGTANSCLSHPREVFQTAILVGAVSIIVGHNHPSGGTDPSVEDRRVTNRLKEAGSLLGIEVLDHVIVTEDSFYAFSNSLL
jgi:DNA repair protein RadC